MPTRPIDQVLATHTPSLMSLPGVTGTAQGLCDGAECIKVLVVRDSPKLRKRIPHRLEGYPVQVEVTGTFSARRDMR
jgi:hypothetical protein